MRILLVEDNLDRVEWFHNTFSKDSFCTTENPIFAIEFLKMHDDFDIIFLDHDLLPEHYEKDTNCDQTTGLCVAKWIARNPMNNPLANITIHSRNWNGVGRMVSELVWGGRVVICNPFNIMSGLNI